MKGLLDATIVAGGLLCLMYLTACGGGDKTPEKGGDKPVAVDRAASCADLCDHAEGASCENFNPDCKNTCKSTLDQPPKRCDAELQAAFDCYVEQKVFCAEDGTPTFTGCDAKDAAVDACLSQEERDPPA